MHTYNLRHPYRPSKVLKAFWYGVFAVNILIMFFVIGIILYFGTRLDGIIHAERRAKHESTSQITR